VDDHIQPQAPRPQPTFSREKEYETTDFRKPKGGVPAWAWALIAVGLVFLVGCLGIAAGFFFFLGLAPSKVTPPPAATAPALLIPPPGEVPPPDENGK
jgi:uncharacterized RDD family membrane protein YckC